MKAILDAFDREDSIEMLELVNNEQQDFWPLQWWLDGNKEFGKRDQDAVGELAKDCKRLLGRMHSSRRLSVGAHAPDDRFLKAWKNCLKRLSPEAKGLLPGPLELINMGELESIDARYAQEIVEKLQKIVARVGGLEELPSLTIPNRSVQLAFDEAHRCYLYGFRIACAVLCRATIDASLREALEAAGEKDVSESTTFGEILELRKAALLLGDFYIFADEIRQAGNDAIHNVHAFEKLYAGDRVQELLLNTRRIVGHLYSLPKP